MLIRRSIALYLCILVSLVTKAQVSVGIKGGPDFAHLLDVEEVYNGNGGTVSLNTTARTYFYGGVFLDIPLSKANVFYLRPQIEYVCAGGQLPQYTDYNGATLISSTKYSLHYTDLPVQFLYSPTLGVVKPWVGVGFYGGVLMNGKEKVGTNNSTSIIIGNKPGDEIEPFDFGYTFTAGLTFKWGFLIGGDFQQGLMHISTPAGYGTPRPNTRNVVWGAHVGYKWTLK